MWRRLHRALPVATTAVAVLALALVLSGKTTATQADVWTLVSLDEGAYFVSLQMDSLDAPHLAYEWPWGTIKYASRQAGSWTTSTVTTHGRYPSLAVDRSGVPRISYAETNNNDLAYAEWRDGSWNAVTVDSIGDVGVYTSLSLDSAGRPHISYADRGSGDLKYAFLDGDTWLIETVDGGLASYFEHSSIAVDATKVPHIAYYAGGDLRYASRSGGAWSSSTVDSSGTAGSFCSLAMSSSSTPHISYYSFTDNAIKYATRPESSWQITDVHPGSYSSLALDLGDHPSILFWNQNSADYAWYDGVGWSTEAIGDVGTSSGENWRFAIATNSRGRPSVAYWGEGSSLTYADRLLAQPSVGIIEESGGSLAGADGVTIIVPGGSVTDTVVITYTPQTVASSGGLASTGYAFGLSAVYSGTQEAAQVVAGGSYTTIISYTNIDPVVENDVLGLYWWDADLAQWTQQGISSTLDAASDRITAEVEHFSRFAVLGEARRVFLPLVVRD